MNNYFKFTLTAIRLNKLLIAFIVTVFLVICFSSTIKFQSFAGKNTQDDQIASLLKQMQDADWNIRSTAFYEFLNLAFREKFNGQTAQISSTLSRFLTKRPTDADEIRLTLIQLLEKEDNYVQNQDEKFERIGETLTEEYTNYYGDLIGTVSGLKDPRAVNALVGAITTGNMATKGLIRIAPYSLDAVAEKVDSNDFLTRNSATRVLSEMLEPANIDTIETTIPGSRERIKQLLIKKAGDADCNVRLSAVEGLAKLQDADTLRTLEDVSKHDPYESAKGETKSYPVREAAKKYLSRVKQN